MNKVLLVFLGLLVAAGCSRKNEEVPEPSPHLEEPEAESEPSNPASSAAPRPEERRVEKEAATAPEPGATPVHGQVSPLKPPPALTKENLAELIREPADPSTIPAGVVVESDPLGSRIYEPEVVRKPSYADPEKTKQHPSLQPAFEDGTLVDGGAVVPVNLEDPNPQPHLEIPDEYKEQMSTDLKPLLTELNLLPELDQAERIALIEKKLGAIEPSAAWLNSESPPTEAQLKLFESIRRKWIEREITAFFEE